MIIGVLKETQISENRVALVPQFMPILKNNNYQIQIETEAGLAAGFTDTQYRNNGAEIINDRQQLIQHCNILVCVQPPESKQLSEDIKLLSSSKYLMGLLNPFLQPSPFRKLVETGCHLFSLELIPRISRAQSMDVLSSMSMVAGYKAVMLAANTIQKFLPMIMAATTLRPAKVLVIGAGVTGLQAIATAKRLGAKVFAYDVREAALEQIESLGAVSLRLPLQAEETPPMSSHVAEQSEEFYHSEQELIAKYVAEADVVITTATIPDKKAPILITKDMVDNMSSGSVIIDVAATHGGNCELTAPDEIVTTENNIKILAPTNLLSDMAHHASTLYAKNVCEFLCHLQKNYFNNELSLEDEIVKGTLIASEGEILNPLLCNITGAKP